jgi:nicotinate-nucleotide adenylyltransferase
LERIGLYGGTFNPIHVGHLRSAWEVREAFGLTSVVFIPAALPPHKKSGRIENARNRLEMIRLALEDCAGFVVSDVELQRSGPSYTIDTVKHFKSTLAGDSEFHFIIGSDAFLEINTWKSFRELLSLIPFIVMARPHPASKSEEGPIAVLQDFLGSKISRGFVFHPESQCYYQADMMPVYVQNVTPLDISSTRIRAMIREGRSPRFLIPDSVEKYIQAKGLYQ